MGGHRRSNTSVLQLEERSEMAVTIDLWQDSTLSSYIFALVMDEYTGKNCNRFLVYVL